MSCPPGGVSSRCPRPTTSVAEIADCLEYAAELRAYAERVKNPDPLNSDYRPFFEPYAPSEKTARNLCSEVGPDAALLMMEGRAQEKLAAYEATVAVEAQRARRDRKRRERAREEVRLSRMGRSLGSIIDQLLAEAQCLSEVPAAQMGRSSRSSEHPSRILRDTHDDVRGQIERAVRDTIKAAEDLIYGVRLVRLPEERSTDERLAKDHAGVPADEVARRDPDFLGNPRAVRQRRTELGLDPELGRRAA